MNLYDFFTLREAHRVPSFGSVSRARRRCFSRRPELKPTTGAEDIRKEIDNIFDKKVC